ncbi:undecaprenyl phosphate translocase family protein [Cellulosimicrobium sp. CUA-896]|uniref:undecaprenyl phosphate translocase family protein n=1 Tax=Cellulosimicrobium sp. CUA-896 TaxID=1517881 RepID=UPI00095B245A|nr:DUF368 domain-containing protein [Cellulosimicrobium sp. CUA-896]OLT50929.1 hypothetical protein BJF88_02105 [Cellulosimicrobium sp. CUA-896]
MTNTARDDHAKHGATPAQPTDHDEHPAHLARPRTSWRSAPASAVRGGLVGAAESVPGISGGTIALVVGLYDDLIDAAGQLLHAGRELVTGLVRRRGLAPPRRRCASSTGRCWSPCCSAWWSSCSCRCS